jgi:hypothetical protein
LTNIPYEPLHEKEESGYRRLAVRERNFICRATCPGFRGHFPGREAAAGRKTDGKRIKTGQFYPDHKKLRD